MLSGEEVANTKSQRLKTRRRFTFEEVRRRVVLTPREKRVAIFILAAFMLGLGTKFYRDTHPAPSSPPPKKAAAAITRHERNAPTAESNRKPTPKVTPP